MDVKVLPYGLDKQFFFCINCDYFLMYNFNICFWCSKEAPLESLGVQWLSGRVLDWRPKGWGFEPHRRPCVVSWSKTN